MTKIAHDSAHLHVTGEASYVDDIHVHERTLHGAFGLSRIASGKILAMKFDQVLSFPGVVGVYTADNLPEFHDVSPIHANDEPLLANGFVSFVGQPIFFVLAQSHDIARKAASLAEIDYEEMRPIVSFEEARKNGEVVASGICIERGKIEAEPENKICTQFAVGGQEHFYLEGQIALAVPAEDGEISIYSSTQNPTETQAIIAHILNRPMYKIRVETRRLGGGFGGKETQSSYFATMAAIAADEWGVSVKIRADRDDDMLMTGKRHDFEFEAEIGFENTGRISSFDAKLFARGGNAADLSVAVTDRAALHSDNAYFYENVRLETVPLKTNTVSNTAFRGFGGPQGIMLAEHVIEEIARELELDPLDVRYENLYGQHGNITPYGQVVEDSSIAELIKQLETEVNYRGRRKEIVEFNAKNSFKKRGISLTPVKFGISFTATFFNQASALVQVYKDGSIALNHGGIEMGQGLHTKISKIVADEFQIGVENVFVTPTDTGKVINTSATAASSGTDLNGMAAQKAARKIKRRIMDHYETLWNEKPEFANGMLVTSTKQISFKEAVMSCYMARVSLMDTGFYATPDIAWDRDKGEGKPFYYYAYGVACSEVEVDCFTGDYEVLRTDILHDVGNSINEGIDRGQIEGAFIQGLGWLTREELVWNDKGNLLTHAPSTYKIPLASDVPRIFNVRLLENSSNIYPTVKRSKAVGEPPFVLAASVFFALEMAVRSVGNFKSKSGLVAPATAEKILLAMEARK